MPFLRSSPRLFTPDTFEQLEYARCLVTQLGGSGDSCVAAAHWSPGLPLLLAVLTLLGLEPLAAVRLVPLLASGLLALPLYALGRILAGHWAGVWAALLMVALPVVRFYAFLADARAVTLLLTLATWAAVAGCLEAWSARRGLIVGVLAGASALLRPEGKILLVGLPFLVGGLRLCLSQETEWPRTWRKRLMSAAGAGGLVMAGGCGLLGLIQGALVWLGPGTGLFEPRGWELTAIHWLRYLPLPYFLPLFDTGAAPTPLREAFRHALGEGRLSTPLSDQLLFLLSRLPTQLELSLPNLGTVLQPVPTLSALVGGGLLVWLRPPHARRWLLLLAMLLPLAPLQLLPQAANAFLPESNLLLLPAVLILPVAGALAGCQRLLWRKGKHWLARGLPLFFLLIWSIHGWVGLERLVEERLILLGDARLEVAETGAWIRKNTHPEQPVYTTFVGNGAAVLGNRRRLPWPSHWEQPGWYQAQLEGSLPALVVVTSQDMLEHPLEVEGWLEAEPPLTLKHFSSGGLRWLAVFEVPTSP